MNTTQADIQALAAIHAGAERSRRLIVDGIEYFKSDIRVVVFLQDLLDSLDGGSRKNGLLALGNTPEERVARGRAVLKDVAL